jgi:hypothetical protein
LNFFEVAETLLICNNQTMTTSSANAVHPFMPELPEGFYWEIRKTAPGAVSEGKEKIIIFLKRENAEFRDDTVTFLIATRAGKAVSDPSEAEMRSVGESMLAKTSTRAAIGLSEPLL